jgi:hypothetical protein
MKINELTESIIAAAIRGAEGEEGQAKSASGKEGKAGSEGSGGNVFFDDSGKFSVVVSETNGGAHSSACAAAPVSSGRVRLAASGCLAAVRAGSTQGSQSRVGASTGSRSTVRALRSTGVSVCKPSRSRIVHAALGRTTSSTNSSLPPQTQARASAS